jgi:hypothetical protein
MAVENVFTNCKGNPAFSPREAIGPIDMIIWNTNILRGLKCVYESLPSWLNSA